MVRKHVDEQILSALLEGEKRFSELTKMSNRPDKTIYVNLEKLQEQKQVEKVKPGLYKLTEHGRAIAIDKLDDAEEKRLGSHGVWAREEGVYEEVRRKLHLHGSALDIQKPIGLKHIIATGGLIVVKNLVEAYLKLGKVEKQYLTFLADLYVDSPVQFLDKKNNLTFSDLKTSWQNVQSSAWNEEEVREGLVFNFPKAWRNTEMPRELREKFNELDVGKRDVFRRLRAFSFPLRERMKLAKKNKL